MGIKEQSVKPISVREMSTRDSHPSRTRLFVLSDVRLLREGLVLALSRQSSALLVGSSDEEHRGRIVKNTGDGLLAEFPSVVDAVRCAVEIQRGMMDRNTDTLEDKRITFRVGRRDR